MIIFGGAANDTWQLPLSGPQANVWSELVVPGEHPPVHAYWDYGVDRISAVYDPQGKRVIVLLDSTAVDLWELSLSGTPAWRRLVTAGPSPWAELQGGSIVLDRGNHRLFAAGGLAPQSGVWTLSLDATPTWARVADGPLPTGGLWLTPFVLDASRGQLVFFGETSLGEVWGLSLSTAEWTVLDATYGPEHLGFALLLDAPNDRLVLMGSESGYDGVALFSLATNAWDLSSYDSAGFRGTSGVLDAARGRALYFSGERYDDITNAISLTNATWALALDTLALTPLVPATQKADLEMGGLRGGVGSHAGHGDRFRHVPGRYWWAARQHVQPRSRDGRLDAPRRRHDADDFVRSQRLRSGRPGDRRLRRLRDHEHDGRGAALVEPRGDLGARHRRRWPRRATGAHRRLRRGPPPHGDPRRLSWPGLCDALARRCVGALRSTARPPGHSSPRAGRAPATNTSESTTRRRGG